MSLGGDSLSYIECSLRLEHLRGSLPSDWHLRTVAELEVSDGAASFRGADRVRHDGASRRFGGRIDTTLALRSVAICAVVATHMHVLFFPGGAHLMLAVAGYNLSRFLLPIAGTAERVRAGVRTALRTAAPAVLWTAGGILVAGWYSAGTLLLVNNYLGPASHRNARWHFWFIEVFVHLTVLVTLLIAIPAVRRLERRFPYWFALAILVALLVLRLEWAWLDDWYNLRYRTHGIAWFFALGWLIHQSDRWWQRASDVGAVPLDDPRLLQLSATRLVHRHRVSSSSSGCVMCRSHVWRSARSRCSRRRRCGSSSRTSASSRHSFVRSGVGGRTWRRSSSGSPHGRPTSA